jgi:hypothetical protein
VLSPRAIGIWDRWMATKMQTQGPGTNQPGIGSNLLGHDPNLDRGLPPPTKYENSTAGVTFDAGPPVHVTGTPGQAWKRSSGAHSVREPATAFDGFIIGFVAAAVLAIGGIGAVFLLRTPLRVLRAQLSHRLTRQTQGTQGDLAKAV